MSDMRNLLESLEARITPSVVFTSPGVIDHANPIGDGYNADPEILDSSRIAYRDGDGDWIVVKFDKPIINHESFEKIFHFEEVTTAAGKPGFELRELDLSGFAGEKELQALGVSISAIANSPGNGLANVGFIKANGLDLGAVTIHGNLEKIVAGDSKLGTAGLESLTLESLGSLGEAGPLDITALTSTITGSLKKLNVAHDINGALLYLVGGKKADVVDAFVGGDVVGGGFKYSGGIFAEGTIRNISIGGDIVGGSAERSGFVHAGDEIKSLVVGGDIEGGTAYGAGRIEGSGIGSVEVKGDVHAGSDQYAGSIYSTGSIKTLEVGGSLLGGEKRGSGSIFADKKIGSVVLHGGLKGGAGEASGYLQAQKSISKLMVDGDLIGGAGLRSGSVATFDGKIGKIDHDGDAVAGMGIASGKVIDFANKGVKKTHSSGSSGSSGTLNLNGGTFSAGQIDATSGATLILFTPGSAGSIYPPEGVYNYPTSGLTISDGTGASWGYLGGNLTVSSASFADASSISTTSEGTLTLSDFDYVGSTVDSQEVVVTSNIPLNTDAIVYTSKAGLSWPTDVVGAKLKRG